jgi:hypothetical protein
VPRNYICKSPLTSYNSGRGFRVVLITGRTERIYGSRPFSSGPSYIDSMLVECSHACPPLDFPENLDRVRRATIRDLLV